MNKIETIKEIEQTRADRNLREKHGNCGKNYERNKENKLENKVYNKGLFVFV